jgi:hypothetical protein
MGTTPSWLNSPGTIAGAGVLGGVAGAFPTPTTINSSGTSSTTGNSNTASSSQSTTDLISKLLGTQSQSGTSSTNVTMSPEAQQFMQKLLGYGSNFQPISANDIINNGTQAINSGGQAQTTAINDAMAARGLSMSPAAATAELNSNQNRINQLSQLRANTQQQQDNTSTTSNTNTQQNTQQQQQQRQKQGGGVGGGISGALGGVLGLLSLL